MVNCSHCLALLGADEWQTWTCLAEGATDLTCVPIGRVRDSENRVWQVLCPQCVHDLHQEEFATLRRDLRQVIDTVVGGMQRMNQLLRRMENFTKRTGLMREEA